VEVHRNTGVDRQSGSFVMLTAGRPQVCMLNYCCIALLSSDSDAILVAAGAIDVGATAPPYGFTSQNYQAFQSIRSGANAHDSVAICLLRRPAILFGQCATSRKAVACSPVRM